MPAAKLTLACTLLQSAWKSARYADLLLEVTYASGDRQTLHLHAVVVSRAPALRNL